MSKPIKCLVLTPVGPNSNPDYVRDTVASFSHYMAPSDSIMLLIDDSRSNRLENTLPRLPNVHVLNAQYLVESDIKGHNTRGLLFVKQMKALKEITREYDWKCLLRLDDDALIIGPNPHLDALREFEKRPDVGMLGAYRWRGDGTNKEPNLRKQGKRLLRQMFSKACVLNPTMMKTFLRLTILAKLNGYRLGDMCTGGAFFLTRHAYDRFQEVDDGGFESLKVSVLADDLLFALYTGAAGLRLMDFSMADQIMAINWRGLPFPLEELVGRQKKIVHPVKEPSDLEHEPRVRAFFRAIREQA